MSDFFHNLEEAKNDRKNGSKEFDPAEHVLEVFSELDRFRKAVTNREIKSRVVIMDAIQKCIKILEHDLLQLPANVENDLKQFVLRLNSMHTLIGRKDNVYKFADLSNDLNDPAKGKLLFMEQRIKNNVRMYREGTGMPPITDVDKTKMQKHYAKESKLPERIDTPFTVITSGVVPLFEDFNILSDKTLKLVGLPYERIADSFVILKNQKLLAADISKLTEMFGEGKHGKIDTIKIIRDILEQINKNSQTKYELMSTALAPNPKNGNIRFAWLIPAEKLRALSRFSRTVKLQSWSLPHRYTSKL